MNCLANLYACTRCAAPSIVGNPFDDQARHFTSPPVFGSVIFVIVVYGVRCVCFTPEVEGRMFRREENVHGCRQRLTAGFMPEALRTSPLPRFSGLALAIGSGYQPMTRSDLMYRLM
jgi:hypothetical protein